MEKILKKLGLKDEEIEIFIFLLENNQQSAGVLAKKVGLSRPSVYGFLNKLKNKGLVIESQKNNIKVFSAVSKENIEDILDEEINLLEKSKIEIDKVFSNLNKEQFSVAPKFQFFEGIEGVKQILKDMLLYRDINTKAYWPISLMVAILGQDFFIKFNKERIKRNIYTQAIWPENKTLDIKKNTYLGVGKDFKREIRIAPKDIDFTMGYWIYQNKIAFLSSKKESFGFIVESKELIKTLSSQFDLIWNMSKTVNIKDEDTKDFLKTLNK